MAAIENNKGTKNLKLDLIPMDFRFINNLNIIYTMCYKHIC